jgi:hypothetical protein
MLPPWTTLLLNGQSFAPGGQWNSGQPNMAELHNNIVGVINAEAQTQAMIKFLYSCLVSMSAQLDAIQKQLPATPAASAQSALRTPIGRLPLR